MCELIRFLIVAAVILVDLYWWIIILGVVLFYLVEFNVINAYNPFVQSIRRFLYALTEPLYRWLRRVMPKISGVDLAPFAAIILVVLLRLFIIMVLQPNLLRGMGCAG